MGGLIALVPAYDVAATIADTATALAAVTAVDEVVVIDDGSTDDTAARARAAGATVVGLAANRGKGGAVAAGVRCRPEAEIYLLVDGDTGATASEATRLLGPIAAGDADLTVAVLPAAGRRGGFGVVSTVAAAGIRRAAGLDVTAPLSGQRAVRGPLLRGIRLAPRFGLEVAMTIDAARAGARIVEVPTRFDHHHHGRTVAGFAHRARQGADVLLALSRRL